MGTESDLGLAAGTLVSFFTALPSLGGVVLVLLSFFYGLSLPLSFFSSSLILAQSFSFSLVYRSLAYLVSFFGLLSAGFLSVGLSALGLASVLVLFCSFLAESFFMCFLAGFFLSLGTGFFLAGGFFGFLASFLAGTFFLAQRVLPFAAFL